MTTDYPQIQQNQLRYILQEMCFFDALTPIHWKFITKLLHCYADSKKCPILKMMVINLLGFKRMNKLNQTNIIDTFGSYPHALFTKFQIYVVNQGFLLIMAILEVTPRNNKLKATVTISSGRYQATSSDILQAIAIWGSMIQRQCFKLKYIKELDIITTKKRTCSRTGCQNGRYSILKYCSKCKTIAYCSRFCQKVDWNNNHRIICQYFNK
jgi:sulfur relay (sulfurtransferase) DsrC/TusE family protein